MVTAADRAAATCQRWGTVQSQDKRTEGVAGRLESWQTAPVHRLASSYAAPLAPSAEGAVMRIAHD